LSAKQITIPVGDGIVSCLLLVPDRPVACYVMAHGAGAGMAHKFMEDFAAGLAERKIATFRYQFPYMEKGSRRPDRAEVAHEAVRAAVKSARELLPGLPMFAGGKSFGGRMTSQAQALEPLPGVKGLVFLGFPLHPTGKPSIFRAEHLTAIKIPMLFVQGAKDGLAEMELLVPVVKALKRATLFVVENGDHSFHVPARLGKTDAAVMVEIQDRMVSWIAGVLRVAG
jgi:predicted alpha/beta-hydrolase family hydrolase